MSPVLLPHRSRTSSSNVIDLSAYRRLHRPADREPVAELRTEIASSLCSFQADRLANEYGYDPWARCRFWRVPGFPLAAPDKVGVVAILVDALDSYLVWTATVNSGWRSEEFSTLPLAARVVEVPAGRLILRAETPRGRRFEWMTEVAAGGFVALQVEEDGCGNRLRCTEIQTWVKGSHFFANLPRTCPRVGRCREVQNCVKLQVEARRIHSRKR